MKKCILILTLVLLCLCLIACLQLGPQGTTDQQQTGSTPPPQSSSSATVLTGWQQSDAGLHYYLADGTMVTGWTKIDDSCYYFDVAGILRTGWLSLESGRYYLGSDGVLCTGWIEVENKRYYMDETGAAVTGWLEEDGGRRYFQPDGAMSIGWAEADGSRYYFDAEGNMLTGWIEDAENRYYLGETGAVVTGWLEQDGKRYYLQPDGAMSRGCVEIDGVKNYFTATGDYILLVNPWNYVPEGYAPELVSIDRNYCSYNGQFAADCYDALMQMIKDCEKQCYKPMIVSAYRTHETQTNNFNRKVNFYLNQGYSREEAEVLAAKVVAVPGTSEHQLGLAVDIVDNRNWSLDDSQADTPVQKWLMEHCWEYGFILRYPKDKTDVTGIIYEPWHYRYVGTELAAQLHELGVTLEEYLDSLTVQ